MFQNLYLYLSTKVTMIYAVIVLSAIIIAMGWYVTLIKKELDAISELDEKHSANMLQLAKMDYELAKAIENHSQAITNLNNAMEYIFEKDIKFVKKSNNIFEPPHGEA